MRNFRESVERKEQILKRREEKNKSAAQNQILALEDRKWRQKQLMEPQAAKLQRFREEKNRIDCQGLKKWRADLLAGQEMVRERHKRHFLGSFSVAESPANSVCERGSVVGNQRNPAASAIAKLKKNPSLS